MHFDASGSTCAATPCTYSWSDLPPSGGVYPLGSGTEFGFTFQVVGTKYVTLTVTDARGQAEKVEHNVAVTTAETQTSHHREYGGAVDHRHRRGGSAAEHLQWLLEQRGHRSQLRMAGLQRLR